MAIVKIGTWLYGGVAETPVDIIALDCDWDYELDIADGVLDPEPPHPMGPDGFLYYVRFQHALQPPGPTWVDSPGCTSVEEAMRYAENKVQGGIRWHDAVGA
jgi:hypothetical protein